MNLPKKINPDRIKDAIIEIEYEADLPFEILLGLFFSELDDSFKFINRPSKFKIGLFYNDKIKFEVKERTITFNCFENYNNWSVYFPEVKKTIKQLMATGHIEQFKKISVRYINEFRDKTIQDFSKFNFTFDKPNIRSKNFRFNQEYYLEDEKIILNLATVDLSQEQQNTINANTLSIIDICVQSKVSDIKFPKELFQLLEQLHIKEKEVFFGLVTEEFLKNSNPEY
jgi:uncharacterized protein (TIGR04255 family)